MGKDDDSDEAWAAEMRLRGDVPLPEGIALPVGTLLQFLSNTAPSMPELFVAPASARVRGRPGLAGSARPGLLTPASALHAVFAYSLVSLSPTCLAGRQAAPPSTAPPGAGRAPPSHPGHSNLDLKIYE